MCQVSTTLFRTVFFAGFPVVERYSHAYRVSYYEKTVGGSVDPQLAGMDATVYFPLVDFKFQNDTPYWILMETYMSGDTLTWKLYSTSDGRSVTWETTGPTNIVSAPPPLLEENPEMKAEQIKQVDYAAQGAVPEDMARVLGKTDVLPVVGFEDETHGVWAPSDFLAELFAEQPVGLDHQHDQHHHIGGHILEAVGQIEA